MVAVISGCYTLPEEKIVAKPIPRFNSYEELVEAFKSAQQGIGYGRGDIPTAVPAAAEKSTADSGTAGEADYSGTNVQVEGVDEADIVKTDGRYIYAFSGNRLVITEAYPVENAGVVSATRLGDIYPQEMFVSGNKLLLFGQKTQAYFIATNGKPSKQQAYFSATNARLSSAPYYLTYGGTAIIFDMTDRANPKIVKEIDFQGNYLTSRMIGNHSYFVINSWPNYYPVLYGKGERVAEEAGGSAEETGKEDNDIIPKMIVDGKESRIAEPQEIGYIPPVPAQNFLTIVSLNIDSGEMQKETIVGNGNNVFASPENIYIASALWEQPEFPIVRETGIGAEGGEKTIISKFALSGGKIGFIGNGKVRGHVLNQFSMDEFEGKFRIATTTNPTFGTEGAEQQSKNSLFVLDETMNVIGKLEGLAPGERIYSARFLGKKAYLVTFKKVDPLFVIDVSNPTSPVVLGKLKIPGYSDYLHPFDETHIIGVGKEAVEAKQGDFAWYLGMKLAIFDVSDVSNPVEMHKIAIGDRGTDSFALYDHKAFLFDREKKLLVLPIMLAEIPAEQKEKPIEGNEFPAYGEPVFQGAFVYRVSLENGFEEKGRITHITPEEELKRGYYFGDDYTVKRALYIRNVLYTVSQRMIKANALDTLQELKQIAFPRGVSE